MAAIELPRIAVKDLKQSHQNLMFGVNYSRRGSLQVCQMFVRLYGILSSHRTADQHF